MRTAIFVGSFNPFTTGHASIVERALPLFDRIVIGIGVNIDKVSDEYIDSIEQRVKAIKDVYINEPKVEVRSYEGLTVDFAREIGATYIIKGVRSVRDFEYEREQADVNRMLSGIETVLFLALPELASVSSTVVRELQKYGYPIDKFIPKR